MSILLDTGVLYALVDQSDKWHAPSVRTISDYRGDVLVPTPVVTETCFLIARTSGTRSVATFLRFLAESNWHVCDMLVQDYVRVADILDQYADSRIDFVDAAVMALAERMCIRIIYTVDRRDFSIYRPVHCDFFELLP